MENHAITNFVDVMQDSLHECPHCKARVHAELKHYVSNYYGNGIIVYLIFECKPCQKHFLEEYFIKENEYHAGVYLTPRFRNKYPSGFISQANDFQGYVPTEVLSDYEEGLRCFSIDAFRASVAMFRRSLQAALENLGASKGDDLIDQIKSVQDLSSSLKDWAHNVRIFGNWGAHPQDDLLKEIDEEEVKEVMNFLTQFFNYVYVMPRRTEEMKAKRELPPEE